MSHLMKTVSGLRIYLEFQILLNYNKQGKVIYLVISD